MTAQITSDFATTSTSFELADGVLILELGGHTVTVFGPSSSAAAITVDAGAILRMSGTGSVLIQGAPGINGADGVTGVESWPIAGDGESGTSGDFGGIGLHNDGALIIGPNAYFSAAGGNGGDGGNGGNGSVGRGGFDGAPAPDLPQICDSENPEQGIAGGIGGDGSNGGNGGGGGNGGPGGAGMSGAGVYTFDAASGLNISAGAGGNSGEAGLGGAGGSSGRGGPGGLGTCPGYAGQPGTDGTPGADGVPGVSGTPGAQGADFTFDFSVFVPRTGADLEVAGDLRIVSCGITTTDFIAILGAAGETYPAADAVYTFAGWADTPDTDVASADSLDVCSNPESLVHFGLWVVSPPDAPGPGTIVSPTPPTLVATGLGEAA